MPENPQRRPASIPIDINGPQPAKTARSVAPEVAPRTASVQASIKPEAFQAVLRDNQVALTRVYTTLSTVSRDLSDFFPKVPQVLPAMIRGQLLNPDGAAARAVSVEALAPVYQNNEGHGPVPWPNRHTVTDDRGTFSLALPTVPVPKNGLTLLVRGGNTVVEIPLRTVDLLNEQIGLQTLPQTLTPLPSSIIAQVKAISPAGAADVEDQPSDFAEPAPQIMLGEGDCARYFRSNSGVIDRFRYSMLIRLIEPQVGPRRMVLQARTSGGRFIPQSMPHLGGLLDSNTAQNEAAQQSFYDQMSSMGEWHFYDRVPVDRPIDVTDFRRGIEEHPISEPKAATLALGYVITMHQVWIPAGLSLGDLLYSLPLAPGEEQRIAVYEQTLSVQESESLSLDEKQRFQEGADSSTLAIFNNAATQSMNGGSSMHTEGDSWNVGGNAGINLGFFSVGVSGGYGSSSTSGNTSSWQQGSRDYNSYAAQNFHSALMRSAAASRRSSRTGIRLASAGEQVTTKVIANHNHCHALTIQYWEVLRHYAVSSHVDDVQLVCYVPLEIVQFLPDGQPRTLPSGGYSRDELLDRYDLLIRYHDVLSFHLQRRSEYRYGLTLLRNFAADPTANVQDSSSTQQDVVRFSLTGTFFPFERTTVSLVTRSGLRVGPVELTSTTGTAATSLNVSTVPGELSLFSSDGQLKEYMRQYRLGNAGETRTAELSLPDYVARQDITRFEVTREFTPFSYKFRTENTTWVFEQPSPSAPGTIPAVPDFPSYVPRTVKTEWDVTYSPAQLDQQFGGPLVWNARAALQEDSKIVFADAFIGRPAAEQMGWLLPISARRLAPVLRYSDLLRIEAAFQHILQNTVTYSKAVWMSLTPEERAILLERFTIGVPEGGITDPSQQVPLLNCVANEILGYFGNAIVVPFHIPPQLAATMGVTTRDVQEALLKFHRQAFVPPRSSITLPTRGMLGEAVLGSCNACEKIDLTRFWNWQDSPGDKADAATAAIFKGPGLVGPQGATAPSALVGAQPGSMVTISTGNQAPTPTSDLLAQMMRQMPAPTAESKDLTGTDALQKQLQAVQGAAQSGLLGAEQAAALTERTILNATGAGTKPTSSDLKTIQNAYESGQIDKDKFEKHYDSALGKISGAADQPEKRLTEEPAVHDLITSAAQGDGGSVKLSRGGESVEVERAGFVNTSVSAGSRPPTDVTEAFAAWASDPDFFKGAPDVDLFFDMTVGSHFAEWFNANLANKGAWAKKTMGTTKDVKDRFDMIWNYIPEMFGTSSISLLQFVCLMSAFINEVGADLLPISEKVGTRDHPGLAYAFDAIPEIPKVSYNNGGPNKTALDLFSDADFIAAHGSLPPASKLKNTKDARWGSDTYPQSDFPTTLDRPKTGFIQEADFYKFRGRGYIQVTWRGNYLKVIDLVKTYTGSNAKILSYKSKWATMPSDTVATKSTNAEWDDLFQNTDLIIPCTAIGIHNRAGGNYLKLATDAPTLNGKGMGSIWRVGKSLSGGDSYANLFKRRVIQILNALGNDRFGTTSTAPAGRAPVTTKI